ncbi:hypothetical protein VPNG_09544 [Cytospora leucostoma]|uniref:Uncharacterized protein n=1 Tax=Cytospora leucostoma TaxID=1230097 RepID=A0A423VQD9_9PEZI|nr:hypothetical protein VPNG_09544 [Cytospora leucostoma]
MSSTGKAVTPYDIIADWGLTLRETEVVVKGLSIMLKNDKELKPDYKELAEAAGFNSGSSAGKCWWYLRKKLEAGAAANPTSKTSKSRNKANVKTNKKAATKANKKANTKANIKAEAEANTDVETEGNTDDETEVDTESETEAGTDVEIEGNTDVETEANTESETEAGTDGETETGTDGETETGTDGEADSIVEVDAEGVTIVPSVGPTSSNKRKDAPTPAATEKPVVRPAIGLTGDEPWDPEPEEYEEEGFVFEHDSDYSPGTWDTIYDTLLKK